jgi:hypothetical protein
VQLQRPIIRFQFLEVTIGMTLGNSAITCRSTMSSCRWVDKCFSWCSLAEPIEPIQHVAVRHGGVSRGPHSPGWHPGRSRTGRGPKIWADCLHWRCLPINKQQQATWILGATVQQLITTNPRQLITPAATLPPSASPRTCGLLKQDYKGLNYYPHLSGHLTLLEEGAA